jgi:hypothetical protein
MDSINYQSIDQMEQWKRRSLLMMAGWELKASVGLQTHNSWLSVVMTIRYVVSGQLSKIVTGLQGLILSTASLARYFYVETRQHIYASNKVPGQSCTGKDGPFPCQKDDQ